MTVDTALTDNHLDIAAYSTPVTIDFHNVLIFTRFDRIPVEIEASEAEKIARTFNNTLPYINNILQILSSQFTTCCIYPYAVLALSTRHPFTHSFNILSSFSYIFFIFF